MKRLILDEAIWEVMCFKANYRGYEMYKEINLPKIYLLVHFLRSISCVENMNLLNCPLYFIWLECVYLRWAKIHTTSQINVENNQNE